MQLKSKMLCFWRSKPTEIPVVRQGVCGSSFRQPMNHANTRDTRPPKHLYSLVMEIGFETHQGVAWQQLHHRLR
jgi:hypothetical protein